MFRFFETYASTVGKEDEYVIGFIEGILSKIIVIIPVGIIIGFSLVFLWERWLRKMDYVKAIFCILLFYTLIFFLFFPLDYILQSVSNSSQLNHSELLAYLETDEFKFIVLSNFIFWFIITFFIILFLSIRDKFGPITFVNFLKGKYHKPKREERIFMFMDLKSSTTIAERLGEEQYFKFLNDTFSIATPAILLTEGEIYQYVGDEIVISWITRKGINKVNCINCYYKVMKLLAEKAEYFEHTYGTQPAFKAGLHFGNVITGEMGIVKKEIVYSGDVLNTASRIQSLCNEMNTEILISHNLIKRIDLSDLQKQTKSMGIIDLRGKQEKIELVTLLDIDN